LRPGATTFPHQPVLQTKLKVGEPNDRFEQEADRVAAEVVRMPASIGTEPIAAADPGSGRIVPLVQRICATCAGAAGPHSAPTHDEEGLLRAKPAPGGIAMLGPDTASSVETAITGGRPLPDQVRSDFEGRFGHDFGAIRMHQGAAASRSARSLNARAYTVGRHIVFGDGAYGTSATDRQLLAHELTHVVQQGAAPPLDKGLRSHAATVGGDSSPVVTGRSAPSLGVVQRTCEDDLRKCRNFLNWSDGGHWQGAGPEPDCNCDRSGLIAAREACGNRFNWSDGGYWIGSGPEPDCSLSSSVTKTSTITYLFPTNECVQQYYSDRGQIATHLSSLAGAVTAGALSKFSPAIGIPAGIAVNEGIGLIPQAPIGVGYPWERVITVTYNRSAHPWGVNNLIIGVESAIYDETNQIVHGYSTSQVVSEDVAVRLGPVLTAEPGLNLTITCPRGNALSF
jgi:hypothetical protein